MKALPAASNLPILKFRLFHDVFLNHSRYNDLSVSKTQMHLLSVPQYLNLITFVLFSTKCFMCNSFSPNEMSNFFPIQHHIYNRFSVNSR